MAERTLYEKLMFYYTPCAGGRSFEAQSPEYRKFCRTDVETKLLAALRRWRVGRCTFRLAKWLTILESQTTDPASTRVHPRCMIRLAKWLTILLYWATDPASTTVLPRCMICLAKWLTILIY